DEAHNLESQLVSVFTARFSHDEMREWFGAPLPRLAQADEYRPVLAEHVERLQTRRAEIVRALDVTRPPALPADVFLESPATRARLEPALFAEVGAILAAHPDDKGLIHVASYEMGRRLVHDLAARAPRESRRLLWIDSAGSKSPALDHHRASPLPTVLVSP